MTREEFKKKYLFDERFEFCENCKHSKIVTSMSNILVCTNPELDKEITVCKTSYCDAWEENECND